MTITLPSMTSWKTTLGGFVTGGLLFLSSYMQNGNSINIHDPKFWAAFVVAAWGYVQKDANVTGGTTPNSTNSPTVVAATSAPKP